MALWRKNFLLSPAVYILLSPATGKLHVALGPGLRYEPVQERRLLLPPGLSSAVYFAGILFLFVCVIKLRNEPLAEKLLVVL